MSAFMKAAGVFNLKSCSKKFVKVLVQSHTKTLYRKTVQENMEDNI
jgi:hypothetical protein